MNVDKKLYTRKEALLAGEKFYYTGKICKLGHIPKRYATGRCVECSIIEATIRNKTPKRKEYQKIYNTSPIMKVKQKAYTDSSHGKMVRATYKSEQYKNNLNFRLILKLRSRIRTAVKRNQKSGSAVRDLGCSIENFKLHLESKFRDGMTWENQGSHWHIDHIRPLASFDLTNREKFLEACHYTNMQPLLKEENLSKKDRLDWKKEAKKNG
jgi:hypothetical protein